MKAILLLLLSAAASLAQTEKWSYTIPGVPGFAVDQVEIRELRHDSAGNVAVVIRYHAGGGFAEQVRWIAGNGKELGAVVPEFSNAKIVSVSRTALLLTSTNPETFEVVLQKVTRKGTQVVSKLTNFGTADVEVMGLATPPESPTQTGFFLQQRLSPVGVEIKRFTVK